MKTTLKPETMTFLPKNTDVQIGDRYGVKTLFGIYNIRVIKRTPKTFTFESDTYPSLSKPRTIRMSKKYGAWNISLTNPFTQEEINEAFRKDREEAKYR